jgi:hypothetical protein
MISIGEFAAQAAVSTIEGQKLQSMVREFIAERSTCSFPWHQIEIVDSVAEAVTEYRGHIQEWILEEEKERQSRQKKVNNVINDISRICRELLNHSIICKSKKGGNVYEAVEVEEKAPRTVGVGATAPISSGMRADEDDLHAVCSKDMHRVLSVLTMYHPLEKVAKEVLNMLEKEKLDTTAP